ncbi:MULTISPECIES: hypothetical protein [Pseudomonas]|uniref:Transposase n=1 Tax=Pseudomonas sessilinigenes TaxID=658629 RepID=A0ABX8MZ15_9PSED|nr:MULTISPECIES: hypothetical protein [Pseudomonas]MCU7647756.1 hypothetical protein [Pseudomonas piscis]QXH43890.1 hypothetical protein KSS89_29630 [Pseudomonas sessilinigenes]UMZ15428.1 hypothetical protein I9018_29605 [Pseudomonas sp. MPFS]
MSRSLGLREDQRLGQTLALRIAGLFVPDACWLERQQAGLGKPAVRMARHRYRSDRLTD